MRWCRGREVSTDLGGRWPTVPCTALPSNGDGWLLDGGCMLLWQLLWSERWFGDQFGPSKCMMWTKRSKAAQPPPLDQTDIDQHWRSSVEALPWISDVARGVGPLGGARWHQLTWHCGPMAPCHICLPSMHTFLSIFVNFPAYC
jgi:hypothetical protein